LNGVVWRRIDLEGNRSTPVARHLDEICHEHLCASRHLRLSQGLAGGKSRRESGIDGGACVCDASHEDQATPGVRAARAEPVAGRAIDRTEPFEAHATAALVTLSPSAPVSRARQTRQVRSMLPVSLNQRHPRRTVAVDAAARRLARSS
jgi:hypothetical protein